MSKVESLEPIKAVQVKGFKSFAEEQRIQISPLTLLAGANSSGKSSVLQPVLLLKQTLEQSYDPGPLLLEGPHVHFTSASQALARLHARESLDEFEVALTVGAHYFKNVYRKKGDYFDLIRTVRRAGRELVTLEPGMSGADLEKILPVLKAPRVNGKKVSWEVRRDRCFLGIFAEGTAYHGIPFTYSLDQALRSIIHVPGLRGNPKRTYGVTAVEGHFQGTFDPYAASVVSFWQKTKDGRLEGLREAMQRLGLTRDVKANPIDATNLELLVGRLPGKQGDADDLVNIADVGFGVSQVLPVLVALLVAKPGQLVYIEQPELHLHPRAQQALASILADAADRGARVVVETHSSILLLAIQTLVAEGKLASDKVKLHWFQRDSRGATKVTSGELDPLGAYGDWPEDFGEVMAGAEDRYLDAVETKSLPPRKNAKK